MNDQEFQFLVSVLQRAPVLPGEVLALNAIIEKIKPKPQETDHAN